MFVTKMGKNISPLAAFTSLFGRTTIPLSTIAANLILHTCHAGKIHKEKGKSKSKNAHGPVFYGIPANLSASRPVRLIIRQPRNIINTPGAKRSPKRIPPFAKTIAFGGLMVRVTPLGVSLLILHAPDGSRGLTPKGVTLT